ncbi:hypothetical protein EQV77_16860 [Halobacillus fulvus]|nr:hypothetical protein EQV77_16860 [Halobacillus fulvus]
MFNSYEEIKQWRQDTIQSVEGDHADLNAFHDQIMNHTFTLALEKVKSEQGEPPAPFVFFLMGSAGRYEQSIWSDQDHGILFRGDDVHQSYFLQLGEEISTGLGVTGYEKCDGNVMASNPLWCQPVEVFKQQITDWLNEESWQTLRNFSIFFDSRSFHGEDELLLEAKQHSFSLIDGHPHLYERLMDNFEYMKKGVGVFGQLLPDQKDAGKNELHLKHTVYFPYVNALRLLALKKNLTTASTISRFEQLRFFYPFIATYEKDFRRFLELRLLLKKGEESYEKVHLLSIEKLSKKDKQELKHLIRRGQRLFTSVTSVMKEEVPS